MTTAAEFLRDFSNVDVAFRSQTGPINAGLAFFQQRHSLDFADRRQTRAFVIPNTTAYTRYRLQVTANHGGAATQLAEWELLG